MKKLVSIVASLFLLISVSAKAQERARLLKNNLLELLNYLRYSKSCSELKAGDKIYLNETIYACGFRNTNIIIRSINIYNWRNSSCNGYIPFFDPATNDGKIVASVKQGSLKVISGLNK